MIGIDAGVLLGFFEQNNGKRAQAAEALLRRAGPTGECFIHPLVLVEMALVLERSFKFERAKVAEYLEHILHAPEFTVSGADAAVRALELYCAGTASFRDYLLAELNRAAGCETTVTFDVCTAESAGYTHLTG